ncbi:isoflavone reductase-like protein-like [Hibiscus syriacus]|uniref:Isoflavone reductase-like protein-like n=1 Tax=Hibiscus syriacus TaxID=106335 RepID=A0A6A3BER6_HIBSY|nr:isoflavone reductase-like protein-like [Hibiscus syriacus]
MGSLMAGWDSPVSDSESAILLRNRSLTKEEIQAYWKSKKKTEEDHLKAIHSPSDSSNQLQETRFEENGSKFMRSSSMPLPRAKQGFPVTENIIENNGWWTRSNWAFLNEPSVPDGPTNSYTSQFHIANLADKDTGIST